MLIEHLVNDTVETTIKPAVPIAAEPMISSDALLQASRRVDWRFLLPEPSLGRVAFFGAAQGSRVESLQLFCKSLTILQANWPPEAYSRAEELFDGVVWGSPPVERPLPTTLPPIAKLVKPGGFLYAEIYGPTFAVKKQLRRGKLPLCDWQKLRPQGFVRPLELLGFSHIQLHWHWPNFEACTKIMALDGETAVRFALASDKNSTVARLQGLLGQGLLQSGLMPHLVPCFSIVAQRWE